MSCAAPVAHLGLRGGQLPEGKERTPTILEGKETPPFEKESKECPPLESSMPHFQEEK